MKIADYLQRINYQGSTDVSYETLRVLHRAHLLAISYENLDIHYGKTLPLDEAYFYEKVVTQRRGGWCYEMNGLFAWALRELGFEVTLLAGTVSRATDGADAEGNHLCLLVTLEQPYLADVGFGNGLLEPIPLVEGEFTQGYLTYGLHHDGERWQFTNSIYGGIGFDFTLQPYVLEDFAARCHYLQSSPASGFVRLTVCHRFTPEGFVTLRGATLRTITEAGAQERIITTHADYLATLTDVFDLPLPNTEPLWEKVWRDHQAWVATL